MNMIEKLHQQFVIPVVRETRESELELLSIALADGGLKILELTLMSPAAYSVIKKLSASKDLIVGAGTVTTLEEAKKAIDAGARFLVSPGLPVKAVEYSLSKNVPFYPGVLTPTEIIQAKELGCELMKVFPISAVGGVNYLKTLSGPFPGLKWMATGGVGLADIKSFYKAGVTCVGLGNFLTPTELVNKKDWKTLSEIAQDCLIQVNEARKP